MRFSLSTLAALVLLGGCSESAPTSAELGLAQPVPEVDGTWVWDEVTHIRATPFTVEVLFGLTPEGSVTHLSCPSSGTLAVTQTGAAFSGTATQDPAVCTTRGGQTAPAPFPPTLDIAGEVRGQSLRFTFESAGGFPCHYRGALRSSGGATTEWRATGSCEVPPEIGSDKILGFVATRP